MEIKLTKNISYLIGFMIGDGNLAADCSKNLVRMSEENEELVYEIKDMFRKEFNENMKIYFDTYNNSFVLYKYSEKLWKYFVDEMKILSGTKSRIVRVPDQIMKTTDENKAAFLSGIFDAEGSVLNIKQKKSHPRGYLRIQFKVSSKNLAHEIYILLQELGMKPRIHNYEYRKEICSFIHLNGKEQGKLFLKKVGFKHRIKNKKLNTFFNEIHGTGSLSLWRG